MDASGGAGLNLLKLCVGAGSVEDLARWQETGAPTAEACGIACPVHVTRMWPRRAAELLDGGSLYWVIAGAITVRQRIAGLEEATGGDGIRRCAILLDPELVRTAARPCRPFQGWRYLEARRAPPDLGAWGATGAGADDLPPGLREELSVLGLRER